jgi:hypothetical protein
MRTIRFATFLPVACLVMVVLSIGGAALADSLSVPIRIATSTSDGPTLGIPRWKGYMSPTDPDKFWASFANDGSRSNNLVFTRDAGATWSTSTITIERYLNMHLSLSGSGNDLFFAFPNASGIGFRRLNSPAESITDASAIVILPGTTASHRASITVQDNGRIWVFTRRGATASENVRYQYSDDGGSTWTGGMAFSTGAPDVRIGSMPFVNGNPALIVLHLNDARGFEYYLWNGSSFQAQADHSIYPFNPGNDRSFSHNQINDTTMHLVFGQGANLRHVWKNYANGTGAWTTSIIATDAYNTSIDWFPITTVKGNDLYVFYCRKSSTSTASSQIYYKRWSQLTRTWSAEYQVSTQGSSRDPNTSFQVPANSSYIPVTWRSGTGPYDVYFAKVVVDADTTTPPAYYDLNIASIPTAGGTTVPVTGSSRYLEGTRVNIAASAAIGYTFESWTGEVDNPASPITVLTMNGSKSVTANFTETAVTIGSIHGLIRAGSTGLNGVFVDAYTTLGVPFARAISDQYGYYALLNLPADNYRMVVQTPMGFSITGGTEQIVPVALGEVVRNVDLTATVSKGVIDFWSWKREMLAVIAGQTGVYGMTRTQIDGFLQNIFNAYYIRNDGQQIRVLYVTHTGFPARALTVDDVIYQWDVLADNSDAWTGRKYLLADLLNIASARLGQLVTVTADGATASQALRYLSDQFIAGPINATMVNYMSMIHQSQTIAAGVVNLTTPNIMYGGFGELTRPPVIDCPTEPLAVQVCGPGHLCVPLAIQDYGDVVVTPAPATWLAGQLCFDFTEVKDYAFHIKVRPTEPGYDSAECDITVALQQIPLPIITGTADVVDLFTSTAGQVCLDLPVTNYTAVTVPRASWSADRLCFNADTSGIYSFIATASNACASVQQALSARVTISGAQNTAAVSGTVSTASTVLEGVHVLLRDGTATVVRQVTTAEDGQYLMTNVPSGPYTIEIELPIGFEAVSAASVPIAVIGSAITVDFTLTSTPVAGVIDYYGWKRQIVATSAGSTGDYRMTRAQIDGYLMAIFNAYYGRNDGVEIRIPNVTHSGSAARALTLDEVLYQWTVSTDYSTLALARKHLLTDLLNIASLRQSQLAVVTSDGATASQAVRYFADRFEAGTVDAALATNIGRINQRVTIPAGIVPLGTPNTVYKIDDSSDDPALPDAFVLAQNYPNPFNPTTTIAYGVPDRSQVQIEIFNVLGQAVRTLVNETKAAGRYEVIWDCTDNVGRAVVSGVYFYRITAGNYTDSKKMLLLK